MNLTVSDILTSQGRLVSHCIVLSFLREKSFYFMSFISYFSKHVCLFNYREFILALLAENETWTQTMFIFWYCWIGTRLPFVYWNRRKMKTDVLSSLFTSINNLSMKACWDYFPLLCLFRYLKNYPNLSYYFSSCQPPVFHSVCLQFSSISL